MSREATELQVIHLDEMPREDVPFVIDDVSVALRLGFKPRTLWWLILKPHDAYKRTTIPKASGGVREIHAPSPVMKTLLSNLRNRFLSGPVEGMPENVTAYRKGRGVTSAIRKHLHPCEVCDKHDTPHTCNPRIQRGDTGYRVTKDACVACQTPKRHDNCPRRGVKLHLDIKDFFSSTRASWIREYLRDEFHYTRDAADFLASLMTVTLKKNVNGKVITVRGVPQGAPTSGDICNLVAVKRLDERIEGALQGTGWVYTRYADDLYFSHPQNLDRSEVDQTLKTVRECVTASGWRVNHKKTQVQRPGNTQRLLGATINQRANIPRQQYDKFRVIVHRCWRDGFALEGERQGMSGGRLRQWLWGKIRWFQNLNPAKAGRLAAVLKAAEDRHDVRDQ